MNNFTTETYRMKRKIMNFSDKITEGTNKTQKKFIKDLMYGIVASKSILLADIADSLKEKTKKINTVDRLSRNLEKTISPSVTKSYRQEVKKALGENPVILVDDSDIIKPHGKSFESLGIVRDGSR